MDQRAFRAEAACHEGGKLADRSFWVGEDSRSRMRLRRLFQAIHAGVMTQVANCGDEGPCEPRIEFDFVQAFNISTIALQDAEIA